jgi:hypothetical protein
MSNEKELRAIELLKKLHSERCSCPTRKQVKTCWLMDEIQALTKENEGTEPKPRTPCKGEGRKK